MGWLAVSCMPWVSHCIGVATNDSPQVALALACVGGYLKATIKYLQTIVACASDMCDNELHMFFVFFCLGFRIVGGTTSLQGAKFSAFLILIYIQ